MAGSRSWHARFSVLTYLQIMVFYNLFTLLSVSAEVLRIRKLVMQLLLDEQLEVMNAQKGNKHWFHTGVAPSLRSNSHRIMNGHLLSLSLSSLNHNPPFLYTVTA